LKKDDHPFRGKASGLAIFRCATGNIVYAKSLCCGDFKLKLGMLRRLKLSRRLVAVIVVIGLAIGFVSGLVENSPDSVGIPGNKYYGFPLTWRMVSTETGQKYAYAPELLVDCLFGIAMASVIAATALATDKWMTKKTTQVVKQRKNRAAELLC
jgi:hypothetical protein